MSPKECDIVRRRYHKYINNISLPWQNGRYALAAIAAQSQGEHTACISYAKKARYLVGTLMDTFEADAGKRSIFKFWNADIEIALAICIVGIMFSKLLAVERGAHYAELAWLVMKRVSNIILTLNKSLQFNFRLNLLLGRSISNVYTYLPSQRTC